MSSVGIIGYGRFGNLLGKILATRFDVKAYDPEVTSSKGAPVEFVSKKTLFKQKILFIAVPINQFENVVKSLAPNLLEGTTVFDVCSIKIHPVNVMEKYLPGQIGIIATHPLFGPDSYQSKEILNFMMHPVRDTQNCYKAWKQFFSEQFNIVEITPEEHDQLAAQSQGVIHFVARLLREANLHHTPIDTKGFQQLLKLVEQNCNDSWELFYDLHNYNPYSRAMMSELEKAFHAVKTKLA